MQDETVRAIWLVTGAALLAGCGYGPLPPRECTESSGCIYAGAVGHCQEAPTGQHWCVRAAAECASGWMWSPRASYELRDTCIDMLTFDAGMPDAADPPDAEVIDATPEPDVMVPAEMVLVPGGTFMMGCNAAIDTECDADESPYHEVTLSAFLIDRVEVTQTAYKLCVDDGGCGLPSGGWDPMSLGPFPVTYVLRDTAWNYCAWAGKRLPTEAEWEYAARGDDGRKYPWGNSAPDCTLANGPGCGEALARSGEHPLGASPFGVLDMAGNVWEWVGDWYGAYPSGPATDPTGPASGDRFPRRGGCYRSTQCSNYTLRASDRHAPDVFFTADTAYYGFRCARNYP